MWPLDDAGIGIDAHVGAAGIVADDASARGDDFDSALRRQASMAPLRVPIWFVIKLFEERRREG